MAAQSDFVALANVTVSNSSETILCEYTAPANTPIDCILQSFSFGTPADTSQEKIAIRMYKGTSSIGGSPTDVSSTNLSEQTGRQDEGSKGTLKTGGTLPTLNNPVFREVVNQQAGYTNPQIIGLTGGERLLVTVQQLSGTDSVTAYCRLVFRNPALA